MTRKQRTDIMTLVIDYVMKNDLIDYEKLNEKMDLSSFKELPYEKQLDIFADVANINGLTTLIKMNKPLVEDFKWS